MLSLLKTDESYSLLSRWLKRWNDSQEQAAEK